MRLGFGCVNLGSASSGRSWRADVRLVEPPSTRASRCSTPPTSTAAAPASGSSAAPCARRRAEVVIATKGGYRFRPRTLAEQSAPHVAAAKAIAGRPPRPTPAAAARPSARRAARTPSRTSRRRPATPPSRQPAPPAHRPHRRLPAARSRRRHAGSVRASSQDLVTAGKVRRFGVGAESVDAARSWLAVRGRRRRAAPVRRARSGGRRRPRSPRRPERSAEVWARGVLGGGLLAAAVARSGRRRRRSEGPAHRAAATSSPPAHGIDLFRLAIGYVRAFPEVSTMLVGISSPTHLHRNLELMAAPPLDADVLAELDAVLARAPGAPVMADATGHRHRQRTVRRDGRGDARRAAASTCSCSTPGTTRPDGLVVRAAGNTVYRRMGWAEYSTDRLDPSSDPGVDWISSLSLGGLSNYWTAAVPRFAPEDFTDGGRLDERYLWPITYDDLVPFYERAERRLDRHGRRPDPRRARQRRPVPPRACRRTGEIVGRRAREHGHGVGAAADGQGPAVDGRPPGHRVQQLPLRRSRRCSSRRASGCAPAPTSLRLQLVVAGGRVDVGRRTSTGATGRARDASRRAPSSSPPARSTRRCCCCARRRPTSRPGSATRTGCSAATSTTTRGSGGRRARPAAARAVPPGVRRPPRPTRRAPR